MRSDWSVETQSSAMFSLRPPLCGFAARPLDQPGGEGLAARLECSLLSRIVFLHSPFKSYVSPPQEDSQQGSVAVYPPELGHRSPRSPGHLCGWD